MLKTKRFYKPADHSEDLINSLDHHARQSGLVTRQSNKFSARGFTLTLLKTVITGRASFGKMASTLKRCESAPMSRQALWQRIGTASVSFMIRVLSSAAEEKWAKPRNIISSHFKRVLIEDSSQYKIKASNNEDFPGHGNGKHDTAGCKVDLTFDLLSGAPVHHVLEQATCQDKELVKELVDLVRPLDLVLRDMGYFSIAEFIRIEQLGAFWLSRLPLNVGVLTEDGRELESLLKKHKSKSLDIDILLGNDARHPVRLVAVRAEKGIAQKRRRQRREKARKEGKTASAKALLMDGWHVMLTNIERGKLTVGELTELYAVRWQIEITFRAWKQAGRLEKALDRKSNPMHLITLVYASILWLVLNMKTASIIQSGLMESERRLSIEKLITDMSEHLMILTDIREILNYVPHLRHVTMESRLREPLMNTGIKCLA